MSTTAVKPSLTIKRRFNAPPAKVFAAWTDPEKVKRWMGPGEVKVLATEGDARTAGRFRWVMQARFPKSTARLMNAREQSKRPTVGLVVLMSSTGSTSCKKIRGVAEN